LIVNNFRLRETEFTGEPGYELWKEFVVDNSKYLEIWKRNN
jgi:glycine cleavage system aminomethyltransferase T